MKNCFTRLLILSTVVSSDIGHAGSFGEAPVADGPYCGIYSLIACLNAVGVKAGPADFAIRDSVGSVRGSTASQLVKAAERFEVDAVASSGVSIDELLLSKSPSILHFRNYSGNSSFNHWVAYLGCDSLGNLMILDSPKPVQGFRPAELLVYWDGVAINVSQQNTGHLLGGRFYAWIRRYSWMGLLLFAVAGALYACGLAERGGFHLTRFQLRWQLFAIIFVSAVASIVYHCVTDVGYLRNITSVSEVLRHFSNYKVAEVGIENVESAALSESTSVILDVRKQEGFEHGTIPNAISFPINSSLSFRRAILDSLSVDKEVIVFCQSRSCDWSDDVARFLILSGFKDVKVYRDGYAGWVRRKK